MKKIFFVLVIIALAYHSNAQQQLFVRPLDSSGFKLQSPFFNVKPGDSALYKKYFNPGQLTPLSNLNNLIKPINVEPFASTMPVIKLSSEDRMPIAKLGEGNTHYTMLVKKLKVIDPLLKQQLVTP